VSGGITAHFVPIADINEMTQDIREAQRMTLAEPRQYLPKTMEVFGSSLESVRAAKELRALLEYIFKSFNFQVASFSPEGGPLKFHREPIFKMHLFLGSDRSGINDATMARAFKRFVALCSAFLSYIAASSMKGEEGERAYKQALEGGLVK